MFDPLVTADPSDDVLAGAPGLVFVTSNSLRDRDEFGRFDGTPAGRRGLAVARRALPRLCRSACCGDRE